MDNFFDGQGTRENFVKDTFHFFCNRLERRATPLSVSLFPTMNKSWKEEERVTMKGEGTRKCNGDLERYKFGIWTLSVVPLFELSFDDASDGCARTMGEFTSNAGFCVPR